MNGRVLGLTVVMCIVSCFAFGQIKMEILELKVYNVKPSFQEGIVFDEYAQNGPYLEVTCKIYNEGNAAVSISPSQATYYFTFNYKSKNLSTETVPLEFYEKGNISLEPKNEITFVLRDHIYLGTPLLENGKNDYTLELLETLPTLKVKYVQSGMKIISDKINRVIIEK